MLPSLTETGLAKQLIKHKPKTENTLLHCFIFTTDFQAIRYIVENRIYSKMQVKTNFLFKAAQLESSPNNLSINIKFQQKNFLLKLKMEETVRYSAIKNSQVRSMAKFRSCI